MTADQEKIKALFLAYLETVTDESINKKSLLWNAEKVIENLTPRAAKNILESHANRDQNEADPISGGDPLEHDFKINELILKHLLEPQEGEDISLLYRPLSAGGKAQSVAKSIIELVDYALSLLQGEIKSFLEAKYKESGKDGLQEKLSEHNDIMLDKHTEIIKKLIHFLWDYTEAIPPEAYKKELLKLATPPEKHIIPNNKLANTITTAKGFNLFDINGADLIVSGRGKSEITTRCMLTYEGDNITLSGRQPFTEYDRNVADAVTSLYEYGGSNIVTAATVYRAMVNMTDTETPSPQQIGAVTRSLDKMRFTRVRIDCTEELKQRKVSLNGQQITGGLGLVDTYLLAMESIEIEAGGQRVKAYKIIKTPILYEYAQITKQVITAPSKLLAIPEQSNTEQRIEIKGYLLRRIYAMKGKTPQSNRILFTSLYEAIGSNPTADTRKKNKVYITAVLDFWKKEKLIKGYEFAKAGREFIGIDIYL
jgi:hypothetical protein